MNISWQIECFLMRHVSYGYKDNSTRPSTEPRETVQGPAQNVEKHQYRAQHRTLRKKQYRAQFGTLRNTSTGPSTEPWETPVQDPAQNLEKHQSQGMFLLIFGCLWLYGDALFPVKKMRLKPIQGCTMNPFLAKVMFETKEEFHGLLWNYTETSVSYGVQDKNKKAL